MLIPLALIAGILPVLPALIFTLKQRKRRKDGQTATSPAQMTRGIVLGLGGSNIVVALIVAGLGLMWFFAPQLVMAAGVTQEIGNDPYTPLAAAVAVSVGSLSAAYAVATTGSAALGTIAEKPELFGSALIIVGLAEGVAIYGLIIAFMILNR
jgi:V/A-type H+-transporting ATPase subunit K